MLTKETWLEIAKRIGLSADELKRLNDSEKEESIDIHEVHVFTDEQLNALKKNVSRETHHESKKEGVEVEYKRLRDLFPEVNVQDITDKSIEKLIHKVVEHKTNELKIEPDKRIQELTTDIEKLKQTLKNTESSKDAIINDVKNQLKQTKIESRLTQLLPEKTDNGLTRDDLKTLYFAKRQIDEDETGLKIIDRLTNEVLKDKTQSPVKLESDIEIFLSERNIRKPEGRGGSDDKGGKSGVETLRTRSEVEKYLDENKIPISERSAVLAKAMKNEGFDIKS